MQQKELTTCIAQLIKRGLSKTFLDMYSISSSKSIHRFRLRDYQDILRTVPKWNKNELLNKCLHLADVVDELKILLKQLCTKSKNDMEIIHECCIEIARELFKNPMLVYEENEYTLDTVVCNSILKVLHFYCFKEEKGEKTKESESNEEASEKAQSERDEEIESEKAQSERDEETESEKAQSKRDEEIESEKAQSERDEEIESEKAQSEREEEIESEKAQSEREEEIESEKAQSEREEEIESEKAQSEREEERESEKVESKKNIVLKMILRNKYRSKLLESIVNKYIL